MGELEVKQGYSPQRRVLKICIDLPEYDTYKIRFEKEDKTNKKSVYTFGFIPQFIVII